MRPHHLLPALAVVFQGVPARCQAPVEPVFRDVLQAKLDSCRSVFDLPGISATLLLPGDRYWNGTAGVAHIGTNAALDTFHVFQAASVTKLFTATAVMQLAEEGLLDLDATVGDHLAPIPNVPMGRSIRSLLNHRSGIADHITAPGVFMTWYTTPDSIWPPVQSIAMFGGPPLFSENAAFSYSNTNYLLLGMIVEQVTAMPLAEVFRERFFIPLALNDTYFPPHLPNAGELVPGWTSFTTPGVYDTDVTPVLGDCFSRMGLRAGAIVSTPNDLARFTRAVLTGSLLAPSSIELMRTCSNVAFSDGATGYGHGTMRYVFDGNIYFGHSGDISGFTQMSLQSEQEDITITISINRNNAPRHAIARALLDVVQQQLTAGGPELNSMHRGLQLYPVPARERLVVRSAKLQPGDRNEVLDAAGRLLQSERVTVPEAHHFSVELFAPGLYTVRASTSAGACAQRFLVER